MSTFLKRNTLNMPTVASVALTALLICSTGWTAQSVDETRSMAPDGMLSLEMIDGDLTVEGWDRNEFSLTGQLGSDKHKLKIRGDKNDWDIDLKQDGGWGWGRSSGRTDLVLKVPHAAVLDLAVVSADIDISGIDGQSLEMETVSGDIEADVAVQEVDIESVSGDIRLVGQNSSLELETVSGDLRASGISGEIDIETVSGNLTIQATRVTNVSAGSVSGDIELDIDVVADAQLDLETHSGEIELQLPADTRFDLDSDSFSGDMDSEFGSDSSSDINVDVDTFSGNVTIRKK